MANESAFQPRRATMARVVAWTLGIGFVCSVAGGFFLNVLDAAASYPVYKPTTEQRAELDRLIAAGVHEAKTADFLLSSSRLMRSAAMAYVEGPESGDKPTNVLQTDILPEILLHSAWVGSFESDEYYDSIYHRAVWTNQEKFAAAFIRAYKAGTLTPKRDPDQAARALWHFTQKYRINAEDAADTQQLLDQAAAAILSDASSPEAP